MTTRDGWAIYDADTANLVGTFETEAEALAMLRRAIEEDGPESIASWMLGRIDHSGEVLSGDALRLKADRLVEMDEGLIVVNARDEIPPFASEAEERAFWDTHTLAPHLFTGRGSSSRMNRFLALHPELLRQVRG